MGDIFSLDHAQALQKITAAIANLDNELGKAFEITDEIIDSIKFDDLTALKSGKPTLYDKRDFVQETNQKI